MASGECQERDRRPDWPFAAMTESRPYRPALSIADAARELLADVSGGKLDADAAAAVIEAAGLPRPPVTWPCDLTSREVDVLPLCGHRQAHQGVRRPRHHRIEQSARRGYGPFDDK
jgi:hypothetical protein